MYWERGAMRVSGGLRPATSERGRGERALARGPSPVHPRRQTTGAHLDVEVRLHPRGARVRSHDSVQLVSAGRCVWDQLLEELDEVRVRAGLALELGNGLPVLDAPRRRGLDAVLCGQCGWGDGGLTNRPGTAAPATARQRKTMQPVHGGNVRLDRRRNGVRQGQSPFPQCLPGGARVAVQLEGSPKGSRHLGDRATEGHRADVTLVLGAKAVFLEPGHHGRHRPISGRGDIADLRRRHVLPVGRRGRVGDGEDARIQLLRTAVDEGDAASKHSGAVGRRDADPLCRRRRKGHEAGFRGGNEASEQEDARYSHGDV